MPISTTDVVTSAVNGVDNSKNGVSVVYCTRTGTHINTYDNASYVFEAGINYNDFSTKYTNRFDNITYYTLGNETIVGG